VTATPRARDSSRHWFRALCVVCWVVWMAVAGLSVWALWLSRSGWDGPAAAGLPPRQILASLWWVTWFCLGLPLAVWLVRRVLERNAAR
jgi:hypothetical protein